jgi:hypothetical protein
MTRQLSFGELLNAYASGVLARETSRRTTRTSNSGGTAASPKRVTAQTIEDSNWLKRYLRGDFRVKPKSEKAACVSSYRRSNSIVWAFWGMMIGAALATGDPLLWEGDAIRINIINTVTQTLGFGAFGASPRASEIGLEGNSHNHPCLASPS